MKEVAMTVQERIGSLVSAMGYEFVGSEWTQQDRNKILRIYIDTEQGVTVSDCTQVSRQISAMLDVDEPLQGKYMLEVSSPGLDRPLFEIAQYEKQVGKRIKLRLRTPLQSRRSWTGTLLRIEGEQIYLLVDAAEIVIPFSTIEKANVVADIHL